jgi:hypothetical protein
LQVVRRIFPALVLLVLLAVAAPAGASSARELGIVSGEKFQEPACPADCQAIGRVSGYQVQIGKRRNPYKVGRKGRITAFTVALAKPNRRQMRFFENLYGITPKVRISVLKPERKGRRAKLVAQSGTFNVKPYLGSTPTFALKESLVVPKGAIVALTVPTWVPAFSVGLGKSYAWRARRNSTACEDFEQPAAHLTLDTIRTYGCLYRTARLLYSATFVPDPKPADPAN